MTHRAPRADVGDRESRNVIAWRRRRLEHAGFDATLADALAADWRVDLHALTELVERGCPPHLAARIMAPLEAEETRWR